jgi:hypothetical protein
MEHRRSIENRTGCGLAGRLAPLLAALAVTGPSHCERSGAFPAVPYRALWAQAKEGMKGLLSMDRRNPFPAGMPSRASESDFVLGRLKQLQTRYPRLISDVRLGELVVDVELFLEDLAIDATHALLDAGITAVHRMSCPRILSLQLPSLVDQHQEQLAIDHLDRFLRKWTHGATSMGPPESERREPTTRNPV